MIKGILLSVLASCVFGILYLYSQLLIGNANEVFAWRILTTLPFVFLFAYFTGDIQYIKQVYQRIKNTPKILPILIISSILCSVQLWLFMWGPLNGRGLHVSLGYFLLPLVMVLVGRFIFKEQLSKFQLIAVILATIGVSHELWRVGQISWETCLVAFGYAIYFVLRKKIQTDHLGGFFWDLVLILPVVFYFIVQSDLDYALAQPYFLWIVLGFGILSALGLGSYILASRFLPLSLFGLLSYLEPIFLMLASLWLGERISSDEWFTYLPIWGAVILLALEGAIHFYQQRKLISHTKSNQSDLR